MDLEKIDELIEAIREAADISARVDGFDCCTRFKTFLCASVANKRLPLHINHNLDRAFVLDAMQLVCLEDIFKGERYA